jgi:hypothetical protein
MGDFDYAPGLGRGMFGVTKTELRDRLVEGQGVPQ